MLHLLFFLVIDLVFFSTLVGMSSCMTTSDLVYVSEWIRQCKQSDSAAHQSLPVFVTISFVLMVQCQMEWMFCVACNAHHADTCPDCAVEHAKAKGYHAVGFDEQALHLRAHKPPSSLLLTLMTTCKVACVLGVLFVFMYDYKYTTTKSALVYTHYYGVLLVTVGLAGVTNTIWWKLEQARNNHFLANHVPGTNKRSQWQVFQKEAFATVDVGIVIAIGLFFTTTALTQSSTDKRMHDASVISEFISFILLAVLFMSLFWRCCPLADNPPVQLVSNYFRFALIFVVLMLPVVAMQFVVIPRAPCPARYIIYDVTYCTPCRSGIVVNQTHCCEGGRFTPNWDLPEWSKNFLGDHDGGMCYTCLGRTSTYCDYVLDFSHS